MRKINKKNFTLLIFFTSELNMNGLTVHVTQNPKMHALHQIKLISCKQRRIANWKKIKSLRVRIVKP